MERLQAIKMGVCFTLTAFALSQAPLGMAAKNTCTLASAVKEYNLTSEQVAEVKQMLAIVYPKPLTEAELKAERRAEVQAEAEALENAPTAQDIAAKDRAKAKIEKRKSQFCGELLAVVDVNIFNDPEFARDLAARYDDVVHKSISYMADGDWQGSMINMAEPHIIIQYPIVWIANQGMLVCSGSTLFYSGVYE